MLALGFSIVSIKDKEKLGLSELVIK